MLFRRLDEEISVAIAKLDTDIAQLTNTAFSKFMQLQAKNAHSVLDVYTASLDQIAATPLPPPPPPPPAAEPAPAESAAAGGGAAETPAAE